MYDSSHPNDRSPASLALFALGFIGFMTGAGGVVLSCVPLAILGLLMFLGSVSSFSCSRD